MSRPEEPVGALALAAGAGIHELSLPTPFAVGRVNLYLIEDEPLTLIDTGPNSGSRIMMGFCVPHLRSVKVRVETK